LFAVAIVGTRKVTAYGRQVTEEIASFLAANGMTVISGLARGVDAIAHQTALKAGGRTIGILGSGVDKIYPPEHRALADQMMQRGAIISDYAVGTPPDASNFPPRNRIISGLSLAVVVIEAAETSGALITAEFAAEQGREIFAVPGSILAPQSKGTNKLIQNGALPLLTPADLMQALDMTRMGAQKSARKILPADETEARVLGVLGDEPMHVDDIRQQADLPIEKISATLALMELKGMVRQVGGMNYVAMREEQSEYNTSDSHL
jgi:DNA processing protein